MLFLNFLSTLILQPPPQKSSNSFPYPSDQKTQLQVGFFDLYGSDEKPRFVGTCPASVSE
jgi:hypothetical protein